MFYASRKRATSAVIASSLRCRPFQGRLVQLEHVGWRRGEEFRPVLHELAPFLEQIAASIARIGLVLQPVSQGRLNHLARVRRGLSSPVTEARAETVHCDIDAHALEHGR